MIQYPRYRQHRFSSFQVIIAGFAAVDLVGALLLMLPIAAQQRCVTPFHEALFTSTSALCVTGLVVQDTGSYWSAFGQSVILLLIDVYKRQNLLFPAADAASFSVGQSADVVLDGTVETLKGTVTAVTGTDELSTGNLLVRTVTIRVNNAGGLTTAQAATRCV